MNFMAYVAVNKCGTEYIFPERPFRLMESWTGIRMNTTSIALPKGSIEKLIGRALTWEDAPVKLK